MLRPRHNADQIAEKYRDRTRRLSGAVERGMRRIAAEIDREQVRRLSGGRGASPGSYPVPARTGHLLQSHFFTVESPLLAFVGNTARYAIAVHEGRGSSGPHGRRPFLDDAAASVDAAELMAIDVRREILSA